MRSLRLRSPAKLNLFLKVLYKRSDGYHELVTLFERIDLCDDIILQNNRTGKITITCDHPQVPKGPKNFCYKIARLLQRDYALANGVEIKIKKRIPVAAGLAGGSSNAAMVLLGLNRLWHLSLNQRELLSYARQIGSDVPFFIYDCSYALGTGRGDIIRKLPIQTKLCHLLIVPRKKMYTPQVFAALNAVRSVRGNLKLTKKRDDVSILRYLRRNELGKVARLLSNDLEKPILQLRPELSKLKHKLNARSPYKAVFSGSGPALFVLVDSQKSGRALKAILQKSYSQVFVVRTCS